MKEFLTIITAWLACMAYDLLVIVPVVMRLDEDDDELVPIVEILSYSMSPVITVVVPIACAVASLGYMVRIHAYYKEFSSKVAGHA